MSDTDLEKNRFSARAARYASVGANLTGVAARIAGAKLFGTSKMDGSNAASLAQALGGLKGPLMKVAQLIATIPDIVPPEYATELQKLQSDAPPMGWAFVKRRMMSELGADWENRFASFEKTPAAAASLGQVHRAVTHEGQNIACKLQYPDMQSAVEADIGQLKILFALHRQIDGAIDTREIFKEISERVREELDYYQEAKNAKLYAHIMRDEPLVRVPEVHPNLSTQRLLSLGWLEGNKILNYKDHDQDTRNLISTAMFQAWWMPLYSYGVIHGDPHLGNYTVFETDGSAAGINLLDYGCIRVFPPKFAACVVELYQGLLHNNEAQIVHAYENWGFKNLNKDLIEILNIWARFIYAPLLDNRVRSIADGVSSAEYGRREAFEVHQALKKKGPITVPREFVFMDRAAIGLGGVFLHLKAELNFYKLFNEAIEDFTLEKLEKRQAEALQVAGLMQA